MRSPASTVSASTFRSPKVNDVQITLDVDIVPHERLTLMCTITPIMTKMNSKVHQRSHQLQLWRCHSVDGSMWFNNKGDVWCLSPTLFQLSQRLTPMLTAVSKLESLPFWKPPSLCCFDGSSKLFEILRCSECVWIRRLQVSKKMRHSQKGRTF